MTRTQKIIFSIGIALVMFAALNLGYFTKQAILAAPDTLIEQIRSQYGKEVVVTLRIDSDNWHQLRGLITHVGDNYFCLKSVVEGWQDCIEYSRTFIFSMVEPQ